MKIKYIIFNFIIINQFNLVGNIFSYIKREIKTLTYKAVWLFLPENKKKIFENNRENFIIIVNLFSDYIELNKLKLKVKEELKNIHQKSKKKYKKKLDHLNNELDRLNKLIQEEKDNLVKNLPNYKINKNFYDMLENEFLR